jgi:hypothetical protein
MTAHGVSLPVRRFVLIALTKHRRHRVAAAEHNVHVQPSCDLCYLRATSGMPPLFTACARPVGDLPPSAPKPHPVLSGSACVGGGGGCRSGRAHSRTTYRGAAVRADACAASGCRVQGRSSSQGFTLGLAGCAPAGAARCFFSTDTKGSQRMGTAVAACSLAAIAQRT